ncbi:unnamed protein product [Paramecium pentaurelia]|uniref:peptidylprolyl isomerase n=1 Tax=Paramecium pentaurelia TaxID=43138 RepID=A0A8S1WII8_9CILI|nr:unnamed protein product [Paramecium pentaurelia]
MYLQIIAILNLLTLSYQFEPVCNKILSKQIHDSLPVNQYILSGQFPVKDNSHSYLAFIFYGSQYASNLQQLNNYNTIVWFNGGPGTSSQLGNYFGLGPINFNEKEKLEKNQYSWNTRFNMLFVDQPIGVGYSYAYTKDEIPNNLDEIASQFNYALKSFIQKCQLQELSKESKWFFAGESYAGKYVPAIVYDLLKQQETIVNVQGVILGNPWTEPISIISEMSSYAFNLGLIDLQERQKLDKILLKTLINIKNQEFSKIADNIQTYLIELTKMNGGMNYYNIKKYGSYAKQNQKLELYLNSETAKNLFKFPLAVTFKLTQNQIEQQGDVYLALKDNVGQNDVINKLEYIISKFPVFIYNGQNDALCTNSGTQRWVNRIKYQETIEFINSNFTTIQFNNRTIGYQKKVGNLGFAIINDAGHQVPRDKPQELFTIINGFIDKLIEKSISRKIDIFELKNLSICSSHQKYLMETEFTNLVEDGGVKKRIIQEGQGDIPIDGSRCKILYKGTLDDGTVFDSSLDKENPYKYTIGKEELIKGFDIALKSMKIGEKVELKVTSNYGYGDEGDTYKNVPKNANLTYEIELINFKQAKKKRWEMTPEEKHQEAINKRTKGTAAFKQQNYKEAQKIYKNALSYCELTTEEGNELKASLQLNLSICCYQLEEYKDSIDYAKKALDLKTNQQQKLKALYRKALANIKIAELEEALADLREAFKIDSTNSAVIEELSRVKQLIKEARIKEKEIYSKLFQQKLYDESEIEPKKIEIKETKSENSSCCDQNEKIEEETQPKTTIENKDVQIQEEKPEVREQSKTENNDNNKIVEESATSA